MTTQITDEILTGLRPRGDAKLMRALRDVQIDDLLADLAQDVAGPVREEDDEDGAA